MLESPLFLFLTSSTPHLSPFPLPFCSILKLLNQRTLETLKERWWNQNKDKAICDNDDDSGGGISIYNIGKKED